MDGGQQFAGKPKLSQYSVCDDCVYFEKYGRLDEPELGYDPDSRKAEAIYKACLEIALKLRNALGEDGLAKLREAAQDY